MSDSISEFTQPQPVAEDQRPDAIEVASKVSLDITDEAKRFLQDKAGVEIDFEVTQNLVGEVLAEYGYDNELAIRFQLAEKPLDFRGGYAQAEKGTTTINKVVINVDRVIEANDFKENLRKLFKPGEVTDLVSKASVEMATYPKAINRKLAHELGHAISQEMGIGLKQAASIDSVMNMAIFVGIFSLINSFNAHLPNGHLPEAVLMRTIANIGFGALVSNFLVYQKLGLVEKPARYLENVVGDIQQIVNANQIRE